MGFSPEVNWEALPFWGFSLWRLRYRGRAGIHPGVYAIVEEPGFILGVYAIVEEPGLSLGVYATVEEPGLSLGVYATVEEPGFSLGVYAIVEEPGFIPVFHGRRNSWALAPG